MYKQFEYQNRKFTIYIMFSPFSNPAVVVNGWMSLVEIIDGATEKAIEEAVIKFIEMEPEIKARVLPSGQTEQKNEFTQGNIIPG